MAPLTRALQTYLFAGWPDAWAIRLGTDGQYGDGALLVTAALLLLGTVIVAPVVEELYFRGYLLPRMPHRLGRWRVPTHMVLFAAYHLWSPWLFPTRVLAILPLAYIAVRTCDVRIGVVTHVVPQRHRPGRDPPLSAVVDAQRTRVTGMIATAAARAQTPPPHTARRSSLADRQDDGGDRRRDRDG